MFRVFSDHTNNELGVLFIAIGVSILIIGIWVPRESIIVGILL